MEKNGFVLLAKDVILQRLHIQNILKHVKIILTKNINYNHIIHI